MFVNTEARNLGHVEAVYRDGTGRVITVELHGHARATATKGRCEAWGTAVKGA